MADKVVHNLRTNVERLGARLGENLAGAFVPLARRGRRRRLVARDPPGGR